MRMEAAMKVTKEKSAKDRQALVDAASKLVRERGYDGVGVAEISHAAGLTQGSLYSHFGSKSDLVAEAIQQAFATGFERLAPVIAADGPPLSQFVDRYLSSAARGNRATGCPMAAEASEMGRLDPVIRDNFTQGFRDLAAAMEKALPEGGTRHARRRRAWSMLAAMVGGLAMSRAVNDTALSDDLLAGMRELINTAIGSGEAAAPQGGGGKGSRRNPGPVSGGDGRSSVAAAKKAAKSHCR
jgi:TetR/AcrR family transcriptional repressor of nem operon